MLALSSTGAVLGAIRQARVVSCSAYRLRPGPLLEALGAAAAAGAAVRVRLGGSGFGAERRGLAENLAAVEALRARGVDAALSPPGTPPLHLKAVIADGALFLDDRNWPAGGGDTILATGDPADVAAVRSALEGEPASACELATAKGPALALEAQTIARSLGDAVACESESFGASSVSAALLRRAEAGTHVRLLVGDRRVGEREARVLRALQAAGAEVRFGARGEKLALGGDRGWVGSANATSASPATLDWGYAATDPELLSRLRARFEEDWSAGDPLCRRPIESAAGTPIPL
jgi:phosphatidylserine/phosphatidylglycerophosphate/cardiolipin synthase-like enzyme